ncbi:MAG: MFS transporter [Proteobacteria bacterium]|nr:MFS transporter [Pseudomonadota bacterium]
MQAEARTAAHVTARVGWGSTATLVLVAGAIVISTGLGIRQTFGIFLQPFSADRALPITVFAFAVALHNLVWGMIQPVAGAASDRFGAVAVVAFGAVAYAAGLALTAVADGTVLVIVGVGLLTGIGVSCTSFGVVLPAVSRVVAPERRSAAAGLVSAGGSVGQMAIIPLTQGAIDFGGVEFGLLGLAALALLLAPFGLLLDRRGGAMPAAAAPAQRQPTLREALVEAAGHPGYRLLTLGFFTCGFQLAFIVTHLPGYLVTCGIPPSVGAWALAVVGLFNVIGSWGCGWLGARYPMQHLLGWIYLLRGAAIVAFVLLPKSDMGVLVFAAVMGLLWLGTVPLTSGLIGRMFGVTHMGTLFGIAFMSHQIGSFLGAWLGGVTFDLTGSYVAFWWLTAASGVMAALANFPIKDSPRLQPA